MVAADHDRRRELAPLHQVVQRAAEARPLSLAQPANARRQALERHASLRQPDPPAQVVVLREQLQRQPVGALQIPRLARQYHPAEGPLPFAEQGPDVLGHEPRDRERLLESGIGGLGADVVAVVERDGALPPQLQHGAHVAHDAPRRAPHVLRRVRLPQRGRLLERAARWDVAVERVVRRATGSIVTHVRAMLELRRQGAVTFDYGNNIRTQAADAGLEQAFAIPGFVPEYIRPLFCEGKGPFRWVVLSGEARDLQRTDRLALELFPENDHLRRWIGLAQARVALQGLPARICWLGQGERARFGCALNDLVKRGELAAPVVIGRDHLDTGSVASPFRETEGMRDGSDAIADWPILNALLNTASGASWVSFHHGSGVGIGNSLHAGQVIVADGTEAAARRLERVLTNDPGIGVARHADAGYPEALDAARRHGIRLPMHERGTPD